MYSAHLGRTSSFFPKMVDQQLWRLHFHDDQLFLMLSKLLGEGPGFAVVGDVPVSLDRLDEAQRIALHFGRRLGQPIWQDETGKLTWLVRDEGTHYMDGREIVDVRGPGKGSKSRDAIWFHTDGAAGWLGQDVDVMIL